MIFLVFFVKVQLLAFVFNLWLLSASHGRVTGIHGKRKRLQLLFILHSVAHVMIFSVLLDPIVVKTLSTLMFVIVLLFAEI